MPIVSISQALSIKAHEDPDRLAVTCGDRSITRGELHRRTNRLARQFAALGVTEGRYVTIALPNSVDFYEAAVATWKLGAIPQPISHRLPDRERQAIVDLADPALVIGANPTAHPGPIRSAVRTLSIDPCKASTYPALRTAPALATALEAARQSIIVLDNRGAVLPLAPGEIALMYLAASVFAACGNAVTTSVA